MECDDTILKSALHMILKNQMIRMTKKYGKNMKNVFKKIPEWFGYNTIDTIGFHKYFYDKWAQSDA